MICRTCHAILDEIGYGRFKCPYCGSIFSQDEEDGNINPGLTHLLESAREHLENYDFAKAAELSQRAIEEYPLRLEPIWLALLAENQIVYLRREDGRFSPSFLIPDGKSITSSRYYGQLNLEYKREADNIEQKRIQANNVYREIPNYDVFISYKQNDYLENGQRITTQDSDWARRIYQKLCKDESTRNLSVFYDEECLRDSNAGWEPHIYKALRTAKCLILLGGTVEHINSRWVKNEWKRFLIYRAHDPNKKIILLLNGQDGEKVSPETLDISLRDTQALFSDSGTWLTDIVKRVTDACRPKPVIPKKPRKNRVKWGILVASLLVLLAVVAGVLVWHPWRTLPNNDLEISGGTTNPGENQGGNTQTPDENQGGSSEPNENQGETTKPDDKEEVLNFEYEGFSVKVNDDRKTVTVCANVPSANMNIPSEITYEGNRYTVTAIGPAMMMDNDMVQTINLPNSIQRIENRAFTNFTSLKKISIPDSVTYIGSAFGGCAELAIVNVNRIKTWCAIDFDGEFANPLSALESSVLYVGNQPIAGEVTLPDNIARVPDYTFRNSAAEIVRLPDSVKEIGKDVFVNCTKLTEAVLSASLEMIPEGTFFGCGNMTSITVPFVGGYLEPKKEDPSRSFGFIFGSTEYQGSKKIDQFSFDWEGYTGLFEMEDEDEANAYFKAQTHSFYIPAGLVRLTILGETLPEFALMMNDGEITEIYDEDVGYGSSIGLHSQIREIAIPNIKIVGACAFYGCSELTKLELPESITYVGPGAFTYCSKMEEISIPQKEIDFTEAIFSGCASLKTVKLPKIASIGTYMFGDCFLLEEIEIPKSVTSIAQDAFDNCSHIKKFTVESGNPSYDDAEGCLIERASKTLLIGTNYGNIPSDGSVVSIRSEAFYGYKNLGSVVIPSSVNSIGDRAFARSGLKNITIPEEVQYIGKGAFYYCNEMTSITVPYVGLTRDDEYKNLEKIFDGTIPSSLKKLVITDITQADFTFQGANCIEKIILPADLLSIGSSAFQNCSKLTAIELPQSLESIGDYAFYGCESLTAIELPKGLKSIGYYAFENCTSLKSITIPSSVTSIGTRAFYGCKQLTEVKFETTSNWEIEGRSVSESDLKDPQEAALALVEGYWIQSIDGKKWRGLYGCWTRKE